MKRASTFAISLVLLSLPFPTQEAEAASALYEASLIIEALDFETN